MNSIRIRVAGILIKDNKILLVRHEKNKKSYWLLPGGGVEYGETLSEALVREFQEEVGLKIEIKNLVLIHDSIPMDKHRHGLNIYYWVTSADIKVETKPDSILKESQFFSLTDFKNIILFPDVRSELLQIINSMPLSSIYLGNQWKN
jgi:ADP-ribose pyrophosphatase YjhB (NUDIX family)